MIQNAIILTGDSICSMVLGPLVLLSPCPFPPRGPLVKKREVSKFHNSPDSESYWGCYFKYRKRCLCLGAGSAARCRHQMCACALWSLSAGAARVPLPDAYIYIYIELGCWCRGAVPGCFCEMSVAACTLQPGCWCRCRCRCYGAAHKYFIAS